MAVSAEQIQMLFGGAADLCVRNILVCGAPVTVLFLDGLSSAAEIAEDVLRPLMRNLRPGPVDALFTQARDCAVYAASGAVCQTASDASDKLIDGWCLVLFPAMPALAFEVKGFDKRAVSPPEVENTAKGAKDAFTETLRTNTALVRRHLRSPSLRLWQLELGTKSHTPVTLCYLEGRAEQTLVERMKERLSSAVIEAFTTPAAVEETVTGARATAFPLLQSTQRTDRFVTGLLDGRLGLLVDGLPVGWLAPVDLGRLMTAAEDRGTDYISASFVRILRYAALLISLFLPALFVAMAEFHQEMIPTALLKAMIESKQNVPFPTVLETLGLLLAFEILQEAGMTLPQAISQTVSIIGGLVVGTAAVEANLISPSALIVVATAGICGFALPGKELTDAIRLWRLGLTVAASVAGLLAVTIVALALLIRLSTLESLGVPYLSPFSGFRADALIRPRLNKANAGDHALWRFPK